MFIVDAMTHALHANPDALHATCCTTGRALHVMRCPLRAAGLFATSLVLCMPGPCAEHYVLCHVLCAVLCHALCHVLFAVPCAVLCTVLCAVPCAVLRAVRRA
eukprot:10266518-Lingulodinium_polyedra.AAC.3